MQADSLVFGIVAIVVAGAASCTPQEMCTPHCDGNTKVTCVNKEPDREDCGSRRCVEAYHPSTEEPYVACAIGDHDGRCDADVDKAFL